MDLHELYVALILPALRGSCVNRLRGFRDWEDRFRLAEDWAWYKLERWTREGKPCEPWRVVQTAILMAAGNRQLPGSRPRRMQGGPDALDHAVSGAGMGEVADRGIPLEYAAEVAEEYELWLSTLPPQRRRIALDLVHGMRAKAIAEKYALTEGRISQIRTELRVSWFEHWNRD